MDSDEPWVAVLIRDLAAAWRTQQGRAFLAYAPGNLFDHPVTRSQFVGRQARAVIALPESQAKDWYLRHPALVEVSAATLTDRDLEHMGLIVRLWVENPTLAMSEVVKQARAITAPASATGTAHARAGHGR